MIFQHQSMICQYQPIIHLRVYIRVFMGSDWERTVDINFLHSPKQSNKKNWICRIKKKRPPFFSRKRSLSEKAVFSNLQQAAEICGMIVHSARRYRIRHFDAAPKAHNSCHHNGRGSQTFYSLQYSKFRKNVHPHKKRTIGSSTRKALQTLLYMRSSS